MSSPHTSYGEERSRPASDQKGAERPRLNYFNYYTEIEDAFVRRRGKHLLLSTLDWALIESWRTMGVPLHVALRGIEKAFDSYESRPRKRSVKSLMYCQEEVEAQFAEWAESQRGARADAAAEGAGDADSAAPDAEAGALPFPREVIAAHLSDSRDSLARARDERDERAGRDALWEALGRAASRLAELEEDFQRAASPNAQLLEGSLTDLEALLDRALRASLPPDAVEAARADAAAQLKPYRSRMERATYEQTLESLLSKTLRDGQRLPRLSLFHL